MPETYVIVPRPMPVFGMVYDIVREGGRWPIAMTSDLAFARLARDGFNRAAAAAAAERERVERELEQLEIEWRMDHEQDRELRSRGA